MKIAVPTNDGVTMSHHFGRSEAFLVFDIMDNSIKNRETRSNAGRCSHGPQQAHGEECQSGAHSHAGVGSVLTDCELVICTGIGDGAAQALQAKGIRVMLTGSGAGPAEEAVRAYLAGTLVEASASSCGCHR